MPRWIDEKTGTVHDIPTCPCIYCDFIRNTWFKDHPENMTLTYEER